MDKTLAQWETQKHIGAGRGCEANFPQCGIDYSGLDPLQFSQKQRKSAVDHAFLVDDFAFAFCGLAHRRGAESLIQAMSK